MRESLRRYWISEIGDNRHQLIINGGKMEFIPSQQEIAASEEKLKRKTRENTRMLIKSGEKGKKEKENQTNNHRNSVLDSVFFCLF